MIALGHVDDGFDQSRSFKLWDSWYRIPLLWCWAIIGHSKRREQRQEEVHTRPKKISCCAKFGWPQAWILVVKPSKRAQNIGRIHQFYHEHKLYLEPHPINTTWNEGSLQLRSAAIQEFVYKFCGFYAQVQSRNQSGLDIDSHVSFACLITLISSSWMIVCFSFIVLCWMIVAY